MRNLVDHIIVNAAAGLRLLLLVTAFASVITAGSTPLQARQGIMPEEGKLAIDMVPFDFSMFSRGRVVGKVSITLTLVVIEQRDSEIIRLRLPQIRSDFFNALTILSRQRFNVNKPIDPDVVTAYLTPFLSHRIGPGKADIFVKHALIAPK